MIALFKKPVRVHGHSIPARRYTGWALLYVLLYLALPLTLLMALLDLVGWALTVKLFGASCYGVGCLLG